MKIHYLFYICLDTFYHLFSRKEKKRSDKRLSCSIELVSSDPYTEVKCEALQILDLLLEMEGINESITVTNSKCFLCFVDV
jgi:hypothetical protein